MKSKLALAAVAVAALLIAAAPARGAGLDPSFGSGGIATAALGIADWRRTEVRVATAADGSTLVATRQRLLRYRSDGRLDRGFGLDGVLGLEQLEGLRVQIEDVEVDQQGRILVFATSEDPSQTREIPTYWVSPRVHPCWATILRLDPTGALDPSFGGGDGIVRTDLGLPRHYESGGVPGPPLVGSVAGVVDAQGRPILLVGTMEHLPTAHHSVFGWAARHLVRLTATGDIDAGFGAGDGVVRLEGTGNKGLSWASEGTPLAVWGSFPIVRLSDDGTVAGTIDLPVLTSENDAVLDRFGRLLVLTRTNEGPARVFRFEQSGRLDGSFGRRGRVTLRPPGRGSGLSSIAVDAAGRPLLIGALQAPARGRRVSGTARSILVARLGRGGSLDRRFGRDGWMTTAWRGTRIARPHLALLAVAGLSKAVEVGPRGSVDGGGRLVVATAAGVGRGGVLLARYRLGR